MKVPRQYKALLRMAVEQGWEVRMTRSSHVRWQAPDGQIVITASSTASWSAYRNARAKLRRAGLVIPH